MDSYHPWFYLQPYPSPAPSLDPSPNMRPHQQLHDHFFEHQPLGPSRPSRDQKRTSGGVQDSSLDFMASPYSRRSSTRDVSSPRALSPAPPPSSASAVLHRRDSYQQHPESSASTVRGPGPVRTHVKHTKHRLRDIDRKLICEYHIANPHARQEDIGAEFSVERSTISKILKDKDRWLALTFDDDPNVPDASAKRRPSKFPEIEEPMRRTLHAWAANGTNITDQLIRQEALNIARSLGIGLDRFKGSAGWVENFKHRVNIRRGEWLGAERDGIVVIKNASPHSPAPNTLQQQHQQQSFAAENNNNMAHRHPSVNLPPTLIVMAYDERIAGSPSASAASHSPSHTATSSHSSSSSFQHHHNNNHATTSHWAHHQQHHVQHDGSHPHPHASHADSSAASPTMHTPTSTTTSLSTSSTFALDPALAHPESSPSAFSASDASHSPRASLMDADEHQPGAHADISNGNRDAQPQVQLVQTITTAVAAGGGSYTPVTPPPAPGRALQLIYSEEGPRHDASSAIQHSPDGYDAAHPQQSQQPHHQHHPEQQHHHHQQQQQQQHTHQQHAQQHQHTYQHHEQHYAPQDHQALYAPRAAVAQIQVQVQPQYADAIVHPSPTGPAPTRNPLINPTIQDAEDAMTTIITFLDQCGQPIVKAQERQMLTDVKCALFQFASGIPYER